MGAALPLPTPVYWNHGLREAITYLTHMCVFFTLVLAVTGPLVHLVKLGTDVQARRTASRIAYEYAKVCRVWPLIDVFVGNNAEIVDMESLIFHRLKIGVQGFHNLSVLIRDPLPRWGLPDAQNNANSWCDIWFLFPWRTVQYFNLLLTGSGQNFIGNLYSGVCFNIMRWRLSVVGEGYSRDDTGRIELADGVSAHADPSSLLKSELLNSGTERFFGLKTIAPRFYDGLLRCSGRRYHLSPLEINQNSVYDYGNESKRGKPNHLLLVPLIAGCILCVLMNFYALWQMNVTDYFWWCALLCLGSLGGFAYCFCLLIQSTA